MRAVFDETLITGNALIDGQHKELIDRINKLLILCENDKPAKREAIRLLDYLIEYTEFHFGEEEKLQEEVGYPGLEEHRQKHEEFKKTLRTLEEFLEESEGPTDAFVEQIQKTVVDWLFKHIKAFDRSVAEYIFMVDNPQRL